MAQKGLFHDVLNNLSSTLNKWITKGYKGVKISI